VDQPDLLTHQRNVLLGLLLALAAASWAVLVWQHADATMNMTAPVTLGPRLPLFLVMWVVMMVAMMLPTAAPMILTFHKVQAANRQPHDAFVSTSVFVVAYLVMWAFAGLAAYVGMRAAEAAAARLALSPATTAQIGGAIIMVAGIYQLTPLKDECLSKCREPIDFILTSWRDGAKSATDYRTDGILPEAMLNFLAGLGWNDGTEQEIFSKDELIEKFSLERVQRSGARFDEQRLLWMNGQWIRRLSLDDLYTRIAPYWPLTAASASDDYKKQVLSLVQDRLKTLSELASMTKYFFEEPETNLELITSNKQLKKLSNDEIINLLNSVKNALESMTEWTPEALQDCLNQLLETTGQKPGTLFSLIRVVTTWAPFSPQLNDTLALLGKETTLARIDVATSHIQ